MIFVNIFATLFSDLLVSQFTQNELKKHFLCLSVHITLFLPYNLNIVQCTSNIDKGMREDQVELLICCVSEWKDIKKS